MTERTITLAGLRLCYREHGDPAGPPIVLLHGLGPDATDWDEVAATLADEYRVIALHQRGSGPSDRPGEYSFELLRDDLARLIDALDLDDVSLIGASMGGTVALLYACTAPARLGRVISVDTAPAHRPVGWPNPPVEPPEPVAYDWGLYRAIIGQLNDPDPAWWDRLDRIAVPTLIIAGGPTSHVPQDRLAAAAARIPSCELVTVDGAGHSVHRTEPTIFVRLVREFVAKHRVGAA